MRGPRPRRSLAGPRGSWSLSRPKHRKARPLRHAEAGAPDCPSARDDAPAEPSTCPAQAQRPRRCPPPFRPAPPRPSGGGTWGRAASPAQGSPAPGSPPQTSGAGGSLRGRPRVRGSRATRRWETRGGRRVHARPDPPASPAAPVQTKTLRPPARVGAAGPLGLGRSPDPGRGVRQTRHAPRGGRGHLA